MGLPSSCTMGLYSSLVVVGGGGRERRVDKGRGPGCRRDQQQGIGQGKRWAELSCLLLIACAVGHIHHFVGGDIWLA